MASLQMDHKQEFDAQRLPLNSYIGKTFNFNLRITIEVSRKNRLKVSKPFLYILTLLMLITTSCSMKHLLWDFMEAETRLPTKGMTVGGSLTNGSDIFSTLCNTTGDLLDEAEILPTYSVAKMPLLLLAALIFLPQLSVGLVKQKVTEVFYPRPLSGPPLYLKLGQLIYYC